MNELAVRAYAKLNISLDVLSKMDNGYHAVRMVMQTADLCDDITVRLTGDGKVSAKTDLSYLPCDQRNIAVKAAELFFAETHISGLGAQISIEKRIPVCAGLGGGSSDGAAVLRALTR
jgi:4-diphosphocytidyl-2-C-methyl-D-erythritol kinase